MKDVGRNDPCPCGSGKKYKTCCLNKGSKGHKIKAKWLNAPAGPNLMERTFGDAISGTGRIFDAAKSVEVVNEDNNHKEQKPQNEA